MSFFVDLLTNPPVVMALVAALGLIALRNSTSDIIKGTIKTLLGFLILQAGANIIVGALIPFSEMFSSAFNLTGIVAEDNALVAAVQTFLGFETSMIMLISFGVNILLARITKWKYIFLTGHMMFSFAGTMAIVLDQMGINGWMAIGIGSAIQGFSMVLFPALAQPHMKAITGNDQVGLGFWGSSICWASGYIGGKFGNPENSAEDLEVSDKWDFLKEMPILMSIVMVIVYVITALVAGADFVNELSGGQNFLVYTILQAATFVAGVLVLLQGVRMFLGELIPAFKGIAEKIVPGAIPALDIPIVYAYGPMSTTLGFIAAMVGGVLATLVSTKLSVVVLPSVIGLYFQGAAAGVFGNKYGGRRGAIAAGFILGFAFQIMVALAYPLVGLADYGISGLWFASSDAIIVAVIMRLFGMLFGV